MVATLTPQSQALRGSLTSRLRIISKGCLESSDITFKSKPRPNGPEKNSIKEYLMHGRCVI